MVAPRWPGGYWLEDPEGHGVGLWLLLATLCPGISGLIPRPASCNGTIICPQREQATRLGGTKESPRLRETIGDSFAVVDNINIGKDNQVRTESGSQAQCQIYHPLLQYQILIRLYFDHLSLLL